MCAIHVAVNLLYIIKLLYDDLAAFLKKSNTSEITEALAESLNFFTIPAN